MSSTYTGVQKARLGLKAAIDAALDDDPDVDVYDGFRDAVITSRNWVAVTGARADADPKEISQRRRLRETIRVGVNVGAYVPGTDAATATRAYDRAVEIFAAIQTYIQTGDNITLGGVVEWCVPESVDMDGEEFEGGFQVEIAATFTCSHLVRGA